jgi:hypothetical protein
MVVVLHVDSSSTPILRDLDSVSFTTKYVMVLTQVMTRSQQPR